MTRRTRASGSFDFAPPAAALRSGRTGVFGIGPPWKGSASVTAKRRGGVPLRRLRAHGIIDARRRRHGRGHAERTPREAPAGLDLPGGRPLARPRRAPAAQGEAAGEGPRREGRDLPVDRVRPPPWLDARLHRRRPLLPD